MLNETINQTLTNLFVNGQIPIKVTMQSSTNWTQFFLSASLALLGTFGLFIIIYFPSIWSSIKSGRLSKISRYTKRNVVMIKHTQQALFSASMIDQRCLSDLSQVMNKLEGQDFDLILHTPGGDIFSSLAVSRLIKQYPGKVRAIIPLYSMSGGSLLALSCKELLMTPNACLGPIDPQLGNFLRYGSAKCWDEIVKFKGKKAEDQSISFAMIGKQYTKSIQKHLMNTIDYDLNSPGKEKLVQFLTDGEVEHAHPLTINDLKNFGVSVYTLSDMKFLKTLSRIISSKGKEGVSYYKIKKWWKW